MPRLHHTRDGNAALELTAALADHGYRYETALHFYPDLARPADSFARLQAGDLLLLTTRPPIEHWLNADLITRLGQLKPGGNDLETEIFTAIAPFFRFVSRRNVELSPTAAAWLHPDWQAYAVVDFTSRTHALVTYVTPSGAPHVAGHPVAQKKRFTVGYFIKLHAIPKFRCGLLCCFAVSGVENLLFARLVRRRFPHWLAPGWQGFGMARFTVPLAAEDTPLSSADFDDEIAADVLAEHELAAPAAAG